MPLKREKSNKRYISSDSEESSYCETPKKASLEKKRLNRTEVKQMVNPNHSLEIRLSNGKVNGISMETTNFGLNSGLNPVVSLNRDVVETHLNALNRKSLGLSSAKATPIGERDEREERRIRQNNRAVQQRRSVVGVNGTPSRVPAPAAVVMSSVQLREHYTHCIQLSATNKINIKNAFGLHLIDYMSELIKQTEQNQTSGGFVNFKLAGSALDAGAKIYCHRVDSVHAEAQKVASSLVMALNNDKNANNNALNDNMDTNDGNNDMDDQNERMDGEEDGQRHKRKKTTKKNVKTLAQNIETLNVGKVETNLEIDPVFHHLSAAFDMGNVNSLLMANLKVNPMGMLLLDSNSSLNFDTNCSDNNVSKNQEISQFYNRLNELSKCSALICPQLSTFEFLNRDDGIDLIPREEDPSYARRDSFTFDLNAEVEDIEDMECEDMGAGDMFDNEDDTDNDDTAPEGPDTSAKKALLRAVNMQGVGDLVKMLSEKPNDYTYFNPKLLSSWAGPHHWKRMPFWQKKDRVEAQGVEGGVEKTRRQRRLFPEHNYSTIDEFDRQSHDLLGGSEMKLKVLTLHKWLANNSELKLPADHGFDPKFLVRSFIKAESTFQCAKSHENVMDTTINSNSSYGAPTSPGMERYDYDDDDDINTAGFTDPLELGQSQPLSQLNANTAFIGDNLVEQPYDLQQYNITFAKFAKKMDVKRLKRAMWDVIAPLAEPNTPITPEANPIRQTPINMNFMDLYKTLPQKVTPIMAQNLSAPIAFVTLLHLCNERNLKLIGKEDLSDFFIEQEVRDQ